MHARQQPNPNTQAVVTEHWTKLILSYARHRKLYLLRVEDAEVAGNEWDEILRNEQIHRALSPVLSAALTVNPHI